MALEHEIKLAVADLEDVRRRLVACGGRLDHPRIFEDNRVFDDDVGGLRKQGSVLRLRRVGERSILTFKGPATFHGAVKTRVELESAVADGETAAAILAALGFKPVRRYQKRRESWRIGDVAVSLDETPMGAFVELEGPPGVLAAALAALALDPAKALRGTYLDLWQEFRNDHPGAPVDMVFPPDEP